MIKKTIRSFVISELTRRACPWQSSALSRVMSGKRDASLSVAKELAHITRTSVFTWMVGGSVEDREAALERLAKRKGMTYLDRRGRPRKEG